MLGNGLTERPRGSRYHHSIAFFGIGKLGSCLVTSQDKLRDQSNMFVMSCGWKVLEGHTEAWYNNAAGDQASTKQEQKTDASRSALSCYNRRQQSSASKPGGIGSGTGQVSKTSGFNAACCHDITGTAG